MAVTLRPCPFCGGRHLRTIELPSPYDLAFPSGVYVVICDDCGAHGPNGKSAGEAETVWGVRVYTT